MTRFSPCVFFLFLSFFLVRREVRRLAGLRFGLDTLPEPERGQRTLCLLNLLFQLRRFLEVRALQGSRPCRRFRRWGVVPEVTDPRSCGEK